MTKFKRKALMMSSLISNQVHVQQTRSWYVLLLIDDATTLLATTSDRIIVQVTAKVNSNVPNRSGYHHRWLAPDRSIDRSRQKNSPCRHHSVVVMMVATVAAVNEGWEHVLQEPSVVLRHEVLHPERSASSSSRSCRRSGGSSSGTTAGRRSHTCDGGSPAVLVIRRQRRVARHGGGVHLLQPAAAVAADGRHQLLHDGAVVVGLLLQEPERVEGVIIGAAERRRLPEVVVVVVEAAHRVVRGGGEEVRAPAQRGGDGVRVLALVRGDHHRRVLVRPLHPLLHRALLRRAPVVAPAPTHHIVALLYQSVRGHHTYVHCCSLVSYCRVGTLAS
jgi:hypothetical protein